MSSSRNDRKSSLGARMLRRKTIDNSKIRQPLMEEVVLVETNCTVRPNTEPHHTLTNTTSSIKNGVTVTTVDSVADEAL